MISQLYTFLFSPEKQTARARIAALESSPSWTVLESLNPRELLGFSYSQLAYSLESNETMIVRVELVTLRRFYHISRK